MTTEGRLYVGTSGYQYSHWNKGVFYPEESHDKLEFYRQHFNTVEINSSFYNIPKPEHVARWAATLGSDRKLVLKAPQSVTHKRRLKLFSRAGIKPGIELLEYFVSGLNHVPASSRGPVLVQLPPAAALKSLDRLAAVLDFFKGHGYRCALEVRHDSWLEPRVMQVLRSYEAALVAADWPELNVPVYATTDFLYIRRHGPKRYDGNYDDDVLRSDAHLVVEHLRSGHDVYVFFNNDGHGCAPQDAKRLKSFINAVQR